MKKLKIIGTIRFGLIAVAIALAPLAAEAGVLNYTFDGVDPNVGQNLGPTATFTESSGGPLITVTAWKDLLNGAGWVSANVQRQDGIALGVASNPGDAANGQVSNIGFRIEGLLIDLGAPFSGTATITFSAFSNMGLDLANMWIGNSNMLTAAGLLAPANQVAGNSTANPFTAPGRTFQYLFLAVPDQLDVDGACAPANATVSCWRLDNLRLVPEPVTLALFATGLFGMGLLGRRRRKTV